MVFSGGPICFPKTPRAAVWRQSLSALKALPALVSLSVSSLPTTPSSQPQPTPFHMPSSFAEPFPLRLLVSRKLFPSPESAESYCSSCNGYIRTAPET